ncbi:NAD+ kinase [Kineosphaera limosa]|uniref:NAD kinase n=1 Tax=Kineosphaera limosa NBRC 100340 TaxID=1184609 RepID=K6VQ68_9MICO|nr:NAD kinase [Kineosphaera limosa]NYD99210.1 NAD+ kinase [Kineosphaera limosa]GAB98328.1 inorganic polyphosphate/ATP-NAD kinase [Kineosphaera limosa NBRC 100340]
MTRRVLLVSHAVRTDLQHLSMFLAHRLSEHGIEAVVPAGDAVHHDLRGSLLQIADEHDPVRGCELVCVLGGDGTILRGAELSRDAGIPLLGINFGHVGFLAEAEREDVVDVVDHIVERDYTIEERMTLDVEATLDDEVVAASWALNEVTVEKAARERMLELVLEIDGRPLSTWGCDGIIASTPTGSTAYAFSAGGPVVWPNVEAVLVVPISAHALFARPLVVGPTSQVAVEVLGENSGRAVMWCDGARPVDLPRGARIEVRRGVHPIRLARLTQAPFTDRLVAKFALPVGGWRGVGHV